MARIKFYNNETGEWEYADKAFSAGSNSEPMKPLTFKGAVNATYDGSEAVEVEIPEGGTVSSSNNADHYGKKWLFIGDSITEHNFRATKNYDQFLAEWLGIVSVNRGMSGTGVTYPFQGNPSWLDDMANYPTDVDYISVMGALNDRHTPLGEWGDRGTDTVYGGVWNYFDKLISKYPNKPIIYITSTPRDYSYGVDGQYTAWVDAFIKTAHNFSIPVLDLYRESGLRPWNASNNKTYFSCGSAPNGDGVHPNELGQELMAKKIIDFANAHLLSMGDESEPDTETGGIIDNLSWESGALVNGAERSDTKRIRTDFVDVSAYGRIEIQVADGYAVAVWWFNNISDVAANSPTYESGSVIANKAGLYVRLVVKRSDNATITADEGNSAITSVVGVMCDTTENKTIDAGNWELGTINNNGVSEAATTRIRTDESIDVTEYNSITVTFDSNVYKVAVYYYTTEPGDNTNSVNPTVYDTTGSYTVVLPDGVTHARLVLARVDSAEMTVDEASAVTVTGVAK